MKESINKLKKFTSTKAFMLAVSFLGLFLVSVGVSVLVFTFISGKGKSGAPSSKTADGKSKINLNLPKTEVCPINGQMFTKAEKDIWDTRRPITAMIENHADSRPPSGLSKADVVYEAVAEGGITRFLAVFYCGVSAGEVNIAPVRSARIYFISFASEYGNKPIFMHVGGANNFSGSGDTAKEVRALEYLETLGWRLTHGNDFDTTYDSGFPVFWRNYERLNHAVATEHTMMVSLDAAFSEAAKRGLGAKDAKGIAWNKDFVSWKFKDGKANVAAEVSAISFGFWKGKPDYDVEWQYDSAGNVYRRFNGGKEHLDLETGSPLTASNVVLFFAKEKGPVDRNLHMFYTTTGGGKALVFQDGNVIEGMWSKDARTSRTKFLDKQGKEISFVRGPIWIEVVPAGNEVKY